MVVVVGVVGFLIYVGQGRGSAGQASTPHAAAAVPPSPTLSPTPVLAASIPAETPTHALTSASAPTNTPTQAATPTATATGIAQARVQPSPTLTPSPTPTFTPTPTPVPQVRVIYAIPPDREVDPRYAAAVRDAIYHVQRWYAMQLDGQTFSIADPTPLQCPLPRPSGYYETEDGWDRVLDDLQDCAPVRHFSPWDVWVVYPDVADNCTDSELGRGGAGVTILHRADLDGLVNPDTYQQCGFPPRGLHGWYGGLAHELGHALGLPHPPGCDEKLPTCDHSAMMQAGFYEYPATYLTEDDKVHLLASHPFVHHRLTPTFTPTPSPTLTPSPTPTFTPTPSPTPSPTPTPTPTPTPVPVVSLTLDAEAAVDGYWSDGTASLNVTVTLRNVGALDFAGSQRITASCPDSNEAGCRRETSLSLPGGFGPASAEMVLRVPMGTTPLLSFDYGGDSPLSLRVDVPERILGVERETWECYSHRPEGGVPGYDQWTYGCGAWEGTVSKWLSDAPVKYWATGHEDYIALLEEALDAFAPLLNLEFRQVEGQYDADLWAFVGIPRDEGRNYDFGVPDWYYTDAGGFANIVAGGREVTSGSMVVWLNDDYDDDDARDRIPAYAVIVHELLHTMANIGHRPRNLTEVGGQLSPLDEALIRLNSHPLVEPGMTMEEVRALVVLRDELLDSPPAPEPDAQGMLWRAAVHLANAGDVRFKIRGGQRTGGCNGTFGVRRGWATLTLADSESGIWPRIVHFSDHNVGTIEIKTNATGELDWHHWLEKGAGNWESVESNEYHWASNWWAWGNKLHDTMKVLIDGFRDHPDNITIAGRSNGTVTLRATLDPSNSTLFGEWEDREAVKLELVLDDQTYGVRGYMWRELTPSRAGCTSYEEEATDFKFGVNLVIPKSVLTDLGCSTREQVTDGKPCT